MLASILLPTRGRAALACKAMDSLLQTVAEPAHIEFMLGMDHDDKEQGDQVIAWCREHQVNFQALEFPRLGYKNLHQYNNVLARFSSGSWLMIWNDDLTMLTHNWDDVLHDHIGRFLVFDPKAMNSAKRFQHGLFPIVPRKWLTTLGHLSVSPHCDTYMFFVADGLNARRSGPFRVYHDRFDETGNNNDTTYQEREYQTVDFYKDENLLATLNNDIQKLAQALNIPNPNLVRRKDEAPVSA